MSLDLYQHILARLSTDQRYRMQFLRNKEAALDEAKIQGKYRTALLQLSNEQLELFAKSLLWKRWGILHKLLGLNETQKSVLRPLYLNFAANSPLQDDPLKYELDALTFCALKVVQKAPLSTADRKKLKAHQRHVSNHVNGQSGLQAIVNKLRAATKR